MRDEVMDAAAALAAALQAENDALRALDVTRAVAQLPAKLAGSRRLHAALTGPAGPPPDASRRAAATASVETLRELADTNRRLLERAMFVQAKLIETLVRAVPRPPAAYGRAGAAPALPPMALCSRA